MDAVDQAALVAKGEVTPSELLEAAIERMEAADPALHALDHHVVRPRPATGRRPRPARWPVPWRPVPAQGPLHEASPGRPSPTATSPCAPPASSIQRTPRWSAATGRPGWSSPAVRTARRWAASRARSRRRGGRRTTRGTSTARPAGRAVARAPRSPPGWSPFANASDGGGSIRIPASACGLVGLKPSQGRISVGPARAEVGLGVEHCVSRTVRDSAVLLDATRGPGIGDTVIAAVPDRPYAEEVGADPGRLRIGLLDAHPLGGFELHPDCVEAVRSGGRGCSTVSATMSSRRSPAALADESVSTQFMALWATQMAMAAAGFGADVGAGADEPTTWSRSTGSRCSSPSAQRRRLRLRPGRRLRVPARGAAVVDGGLGPAAHTDPGRAAAPAERVRARSTATRRPRCVGPGGSARSRRRST